MEISTSNVKMFFNKKEQGRLRRTSALLYNRVTNISRDFRVTRILSAMDIFQLQKFVLDGNIDVSFSLTTQEIKSNKGVLHKIAERIVKLHCLTRDPYNIDGDIVRSLLTKMKRIAELSVTGDILSVLGDETQEYCIDMIQKVSPTLKYLTLNAIKIPILKPYKFDCLTHVQLNEVKGDITQLLLNCQKTIKSLSLEISHITDMTFVEHLDKLTNLTTLDLEGNSYFDTVYHDVTKI